MAYDPSKSVFRRDYPDVKRSNFSHSHKVRFTADYGYLVPALVDEVLGNSYYRADCACSVSTNPTLTPILGSATIRMEAYYVEKATYVNALRNNNKLSVDRNVYFPFIAVSDQVSGSFVAPGSLLEYLCMLPPYFVVGQYEYDVPFRLNGIPVLMYHDIFRNYYLNVQESTFPIRLGAYLDGNNPGDFKPFEMYATREAIDSFIDACRGGAVDVNTMYQRYMAGSVGTINNSLFCNLDNISIVESQSPIDYNHHNLLRRTYRNDYFGAFVSNDNAEIIQQYSQVNAVVSGTNATFDVHQILLANRNRRFAVRSALWGTDWVDYNRIHYAVELQSQYGKPQFLGSMSSKLVFNDIVSTTQSGDNLTNSLEANQNLGSRAGLGFGVMTNHTENKKKYRPFIEFKCREEGYVMALFSIVPDVDYFEGIDPLYFKTNLRQTYVPEYDAVGLQDFSSLQAAANSYNFDALPQLLTVNGASIEFTPAQMVTFSEHNQSLWTVPAWYEYMGKYNRLHGLMTSASSYRPWTFARSFQSEVRGSLKTSTYIMPEMYNYMFASTLNEDNFQVQVSWDILVKQNMSKQVLAYL